MIKNVVFDIGNVLIDYSPAKLMDSYGLNDAERRLLMKTVFASDIWLQLDRGTCSIDEAVKLMSQEIPEYAEYVSRTFTEESLEILFAEMSDTVEFMRSLKAEGYKIFLLSNFSREGFDFILKRYDFLSEVDGRIISSHVGINKPDGGIYECLLDKYSLEACETVFFDDLEVNCRGAEQFGINAIRFVTLEDAKSKFYELLKNITKE